MFAQTVTHALAQHGLAERGADPFSRQPTPMLLQKADVVFPSPDWTYEPKWDGFRVLASVRDGSVRLVSRNGHSFTNLFGSVADALRRFPTSLLLDGEVIVINDQGQTDFEALQARLRSRHGNLPGYLCYMAFDCLYVNGHSLLNRPLEDRQAVLWELQHALQCDAVKLTEGFPAGKSQRLMKACASMGLEGVVMKRKGSIYRPGFRSPDWIKVPIRHREEFVACGYLATTPSHLSSVIVGQHDREGRLVYSGLVGTGLSDETRLLILRELQATQRKTCPFASLPELRDHFGELRTDLPPHWVRPTLVVDVEFRHRSKDGLRHAVLKGLRPEKRPGVIRRTPLNDRGPLSGDAMPDTLSQTLHDWQTFYFLVDGAAAGLVGLTFVAITVGAGLITNIPALRTFVNPSLIHFIYVLVTASVVVMPTVTRMHGPSLPFEQAPLALDAPAVARK